MSSQANDQTISWGDPNHYYSQALPTQTSGTQRPLSPEEKKIMALLRQFDPELRQRVERAFKQWNLTIRDYLRNETALRLSVGGDTQSVPVRIVDGLPKPFLNNIPKFIEYSWLLLNRMQIKQAAEGLKFIDGKFHLLSEVEDLRPLIATKDEVHNVSEFFEQLSDRLAKLDFLKSITSINLDILGAYFYRVPVVEIYWMAIGIVAAVLGISVEGLAVAVTVHELAHAYTHLGQDIDKKKWETDSFSKTDLRIVEGLAQFYTDTICCKIEGRMPEAIHCFLELKRHQPEPYQVYAEWIGNSDRPCEIVRVSMIEGRSRGITGYDGFTEIVSRHLRNIEGTELCSAD
jgi:uncharacterized protein YifE (UPF0438 family)